MDQTKKLVPLEGLRGIAAAIVVIYHLVLGFTPKGVGAVPHGYGWFDTVIQFILGFLNGGAAVAVFFVLSGFILSLPFARDRRVTRILVAGLKRWPRLAGLSVVACLFGWLLIKLSGQDYSHAARIIGTGWMASHGNSPIAGKSLPWWSAIWAGAVQIFISSNVHFDSPLWTMRIELFGSFAIFLAAPVLFAIESWPLRLGLIGAAMILAGGHYPVTYVSDFLFGTIIAMLYIEDRLPTFTDWQAAVVGLIALYLFSFTYEQRLAIDHPLKAIMPAGDTSHYVWDVGAVLMILLLLGNPGLRWFFSRSWAVWLGLLSFPIYLLHGPIMLSAGAASFLFGVNTLGATGSAIVAALISIVLTVVCALPLVWLDQAWTGKLSGFTRRWLKRPASDNAKRWFILKRQDAAVPLPLALAAEPNPRSRPRG